MDELCDVCGDIGVLEAIITCSQCKIHREHIYCRQPFSEDVPDIWLCQACGIGVSSSPRSLKEDLPRTLLIPSRSHTVEHETTCSAGPSKLCNDEENVKAGEMEHTPVQEDSDSSFCEARAMGSSVSRKTPNMLKSDSLGMVQKKTTNPSGRGKLFKWEKIAKTGKVKYIPAQEAVRLSSGAKSLGSPSKSSMNSKSGPSRISVPISERTPIKPTALFSKSSFHAKSNPAVKLSGVPLTRNGKSLTNQVGQVTQTSKEPKEKKAAQAPGKEHLPKEQSADAITSDVNASAKEDNVVKKASTASPQANLFPPTSSGGNNGCRNLVQIKFNAEDGDQMNIMPKEEKFVQGPAIESSWKGSFKILDSINCKELNEGFFAHPPLKVRRKVYEFSKAMPQVLLFTMIPRSNVWTDIFLDYCPGDDDIGLYFFSCKSQRSAPYICLLELMEKQDLVMRSYMDGVELLVFTSKLLEAHSQRWNEEYYLWGIFRGVQKHGAVSKHEEITLPIQSSACAQDDYANWGDNAVNMEIDMLAGNDVGRLDIAIPRRSSKSSCKSYSDEKATALSLHPEVPCVSRNFSFATQKPLIEVKNVLTNDIPPGFEEIHSLNVQNRVLTNMGRDGKLDREARNPEKESGRFKSLSEILGAGALQPDPHSRCY